MTLVFVLLADKREIMCDEPAVVIRAVIAAMLYTREHFLLGAGVSGVMGEEIFGILQFSKALGRHRIRASGSPGLRRRSHPAEIDLKG